MALAIGSWSWISCCLSLSQARRGRLVGSLPVEQKLDISAETTAKLKTYAVMPIMVKGTGDSADRLGLHPRTLRARLKKLGISRPTQFQKRFGHRTMLVASLVSGAFRYLGLTLKKWRTWGGGVPIERLSRKEIRDLLDWVYDRAVAREGSDPGRTANKAREQLRAVISWAWEQDVIETPPRFPKPMPQRDVAGRHYLTKAEINALYVATHQLRRPRGTPTQFDNLRFLAAVKSTDAL